MTPSKDESRHDDLRRRADRVRERLATVLQSLDRRRHELLDVKLQLRQHPVPLAVAGASVGLILLGSGAAAWYRSRQKRQFVWHERARALVRLWKYPERVAQPQKRSIPVEIGHRVVVGLLTAVAVEAGKAIIKKPMQTKTS